MLTGQIIEKTRANVKILQENLLNPISGNLIANLSDGFPGRGGSLDDPPPTLNTLGYNGGGAE